MSQEAGPSSILVAICAYKRAEGLHRVLDALSQEHADVSWRLVIADNDPLGSARAIYESRREDFPVPISYIFVDKGHLVAARNAVLDLAAADECVLFIDDDCEPAPGWLASFARAAVQFPDAVLAGPMVASFEQGVQPPPWASNLWFFATEQYDDGALMEMTGDGNTLFPAALIHQHHLRFEPQLDGGRGQDTDLFIRWKAQGGQIRRVLGGLATEWTPASRTSMAHLRSRSIAAGYGYTRMCLIRRSGRAHRAGTAAIDLLAGSYRYGSSLVTRDANQRGRAVYDLCIGVGSVQAFVEAAQSAVQRTLHRNSDR